MPLLVQTVRVNANNPEYIFYCPGCENSHWFKTTGEKPVWSFNGDMERPTVEPSILVRDGEIGDPETEVCHFFMRDGQIQYLSDCTHKLKGQTVDMVDYDSWQDNPYSA